MNGIALAKHLQTACPGFTPTGSPIRTGTSLLQHGLLHGRQVIAKQPTDPRRWWHDRCRHEIGIYQTFRRIGGPPVPVANLVAADPHLPLLVVTALPGTPLHPDRYPPAGSVSVTTTRRMLTALTALHQWQPTSPAAIPDDTDYPAQLAPFAGSILDAADARLLSDLATLAHPPVEVSHGDAHLGNTLATADQVALLDLEFTAWRPVGYDHAKLFIFLADNPAARRTVLHDITASSGAHVGLWLAVALVACRELASHHRHADLPDRDRRVHQLTSDLQRALAHAHHLHAQLPTSGGAR
ncbi:aminoglycoside phosphotransferase family protein [Micromonospora fiedleri]|uniref:Aminoglycoside phosphotransferase family protein n=1 Tax=Micromonospora fiedleri TaxID=1157498 RepID=A0ABS1UVH1_9ACTN|nr:aminoglycoside phosphotransferase family protein [Micromonospora fiedleri]MBL6280169.1 aminoglycoside phosphotransferase family protein [Micromonospora fiedleri]